MAKRLTRPLHPMPEFVRQALVERGLIEAYSLRPPYQQNDYIGWISRAKLPKTQAKRLAQMLDELASGDSYMGMKYKAKRVKPLAEYLSLEAIRSLASPSNYKLGKEIVRDGGVEFTEETPFYVSAKVQPGVGQRRTVRLRSIENGLTWKCTCTKTGLFCKHCAAAAIAIMKKSSAG